MTLSEQIIRHLFAHETPDCPKNVQSVFLQFNGLVSWEFYRETLNQYGFNVPKTAKTLQRMSKATKTDLTRQEKVMAFASDNGGTFTKMEASQYFKTTIPKNTFSAVGTILKRMMKTGAIERVGYGRYKITSK